MNSRVKYIDGIRCFAALFVTFCHFSSMFLPAIKEASGTAGILFNNTPLTVVIYGSASVQCFFLLSGFLIASNMRNKKEVMYSPLKTYRKLLRIVFPAILLSFLLMVLGLVYHTKAADIYPELSYAYWYNTFTPTVGSMLKDIFYSVFFKCSSMYTPPFWTIGYEFTGTIFVTLLTFFLGQYKKNPFPFYITILVIIILMFPDQYVAFILGAMLYALQERIFNFSAKSRFLILFQKIILSPPVLVLIMFIGIYFAGTNSSFAGIYTIFSGISFIVKHELVLRAFGIFLCAFVIINSPALKKILSIPIFSFLGKYSGYIYAFHWQVIISLGCGMYLSLVTHIPKWLLLTMIFITVIAVPIGLGIIFIHLYRKIDIIEAKIMTKLKKQEIFGNGNEK